MKGIFKGHHIVILDTSIWIYHLEDHPGYRSLTSKLLDEFSSGRCCALISEITLLELLVRPLQLELQSVADEYEVLLDHFPNLNIISVNREVVLKAASIRAKYGLKTPDAIIIATGFLHNASLVITNDKKWKTVEGIDVVCLNELSPMGQSKG